MKIRNRYMMCWSGSSMGFICEWKSAHDPKRTFRYAPAKWGLRPNWVFQPVAKLEEVDQKMEQLGRIRSALNELIAACPGRGALRACSIMEFLVAPTEGTSVNASADGKENERLQNF